MEDCGAQFDLTEKGASGSVAGAIAAAVKSVQAAAATRCPNNCPPVMMEPPLKVSIGRTITIDKTGGISRTVILFNASVSARFACSGTQGQEESDPKAPVAECGQGVTVVADGDSTTQSGAIDAAESLALKAAGVLCPHECPPVKYDEPDIDSKKLITDGVTTYHATVTVRFLCQQEKSQETGGDAAKTPDAGEAKESTTTAADLFPNPSPAPWYPFAPGSDDSIKPEDYNNRLPLTAARPGCGLSVQSLDVLTTGQIKGSLKFNTRPRSTGGATATNGNNTTLGPAYEDRGWKPDFYNYKFEAVVVYAGQDMTKAIYGQMMSDKVKISDDKPDIVFHDDSPSNDWVASPGVPAKQWLLKPGEKKSDFPVIEVDGNTVYWIDAPGGLEELGFGISNYKRYCIVYAGACGVVTNVKVFVVSFPSGKDPTYEEIPADKLGEHVASFGFK